MTKAILFDLCGVLLIKRDRAGLATIEAATGWSGDTFWDAYWAERVPYDSGCSGADYWARVAERVGRPLRDLAVAIDADVASCAAPDRDMIALLEQVRRLPVRLGILSNLTVDMVDRVEREQPWVRGLDTVIWSCDHKVVKPSEEAFSLARRSLGVPFEDILFVDDQQENLDAAAALGMRTHLFRGRAALEPVVLAHLGLVPLKTAGRASGGLPGARP